MVSSYWYTRYEVWIWGFFPGANSRRIWFIRRTHRVYKTDTRRMHLPVNTGVYSYLLFKVAKSWGDRVRLGSHWHIVYQVYTVGLLVPSTSTAIISGDIHKVYLSILTQRLFAHCYVHENKQAPHTWYEYCCSMLQWVWGYLDPDVKLKHGKIKVRSKTQIHNEPAQQSSHRSLYPACACLCSLWPTSDI